MINNIFNSTLVDTSDHHPMLRESVGKLVGSFGRSYFQDAVKRNVKPVELWDALAKAGFLGVHISEKYGGGAGSGSGRRAAPYCLWSLARYAPPSLSSMVQKP